MNALNRKAWLTYVVCTLGFGLVFLLVYPSCNWIASRRGTAFALFLPMERRIPFVPQWIWIYGSLLLLWPLQALFLPPAEIRLLARRLALAVVLCGAGFLVCPGKLGYPRVLPSGPLLRGMFACLFSVDRPHNLAPSLHVASSALVIFALSGRTRGWPARLGWGLWLALICTSTVLVHQHHLLDVGTGLVLAILLHRMAFRPPMPVASSQPLGHP